MYAGRAPCADEMYALCKDDMKTFFDLTKGAIEPIGILFRWAVPSVAHPRTVCSERQ